MRKTNIILANNLMIQEIIYCMHARDIIKNCILGRVSSLELRLSSLEFRVSSRERVKNCKYKRFTISRKAVEEITKEQSWQINLFKLLSKCSCAFMCILFFTAV